MKHSRSSQDSGQINRGTENMDKYWNALKDDDHSESFYKTEVRLKNASGSNLKSRKKHGTMIQYILNHKAKFAVILFSVLLLAACNMPVTQNETLGHVISWTVENPDAGTKTAALPWVDKNNLSYNENMDGNTTISSYNLILSDASLEDVQRYSKDLEAIPGVLEVKIMPLTEEVERPLYSMLLDDLLKININAKNMSDAELSAEVERQLKEGGIDATTVNFSRDENNRRKIEVTTNGERKNGGFQLNINDGNQKMHIEERTKTSPDGKPEFNFKGKTDQEIKQIVKDKFTNHNLSDNDMSIIRNNGEITVDINKKLESGKEGSEMKMKIKVKDEQ
jgi:hypothetical protein